MVDLVQCPCCLATGEVPPHGVGPCPVMIQLKQAEIAELHARKELLEAQREATLLNVRHR